MKQVEQQIEQREEGLDGEERARIRENKGEQERELDFRKYLFVWVSYHNLFSSANLHSSPMQAIK